MPIIVIGRFYELKLPHEDGNRENQWCTFAVDHGMNYLLNGGRCNLCNLMNMDDVPSEIHFATEAKCHADAAAYYAKHGKQYPYKAEWIASSNAQGVTLNAGVESQVMGFD